MNSDLFKFYDHLGFQNPYYIRNSEESFEIESSFTGIIDKTMAIKKIDPIAIIELFNYNFFLADRTIVQQIYKTPWLAKPNEYCAEWDYKQISTYGDLDIREEDIAKTLFQKICSEIQLYIGNNKKVGILLSGGMDSRMVAGALDYLIKKNILSGIKVTCLTWGNNGTRDVMYAKEIAKRLNWDWKHYTVTSNDLIKNIKETSIHGCEYSPIHLHAIPQIRDDNNLDLILAGSYGDSIGRAEYSGVKVKFIKHLYSKIENTGGLFKSTQFKLALNPIYQDFKKYHHLYPRNEPYMQNELDRQLHYMRRMLNPCFKLLTEKVKFYQVFSHPDVYEYMWSIKHDRRNDLVYKFVLQEFCTKLDDIPWARTGLPYGQTEGKPDSFSKNHFSHTEIFSKEIILKVQSALLSQEIKELGIFNTQSLKFLAFFIKYFPPNNPYFIDRVLWLCSLSDMIKRYNIKGIECIKSESFSRTFISIFQLVYSYFIRQLKVKFNSILKFRLY